MGSAIDGFIESRLTMHSGGWAAHYYGYDHRSSKPIEPLYTEITGYGVSLRLWRGGGGLVDELSSFLRMAAGPAGGVVYGYYPGSGRWSGKAYVFDNGVVAKGLLDAYRATGRRSYLEQALTVCRWILGMQVGDGWFRAAYDYSAGDYYSPGEWYGDGGCLHGKTVMPLIDAYRVTGSDTYLEAVEKTLGWLLGLQHESGGFEARPGAGYVFSHAHCYAMEGVLYAWAALGRDDLLDAAVRGAGWLARVQSRRGGIPERYPWGGGGLRSRLSLDATAQAARIWMIMYRLTGEEYWLERAEAAIGFIEALPSRGGGLPAYLERLGPVSRASARTHTWSLMFTVQALDMYGGLEGFGAEEMIGRLF